MLILSCIFITITYEKQYYFDKEKQPSYAKHLCVGKVDSATGKL